MSNFKRFLLHLVILSVFSYGCERAEEPQPNTVQPTFGSIQENIFSTNCALSGCHKGSSPPHGLNLEEGNAFNNIVNVPSKEVPSLLRIKPGQPDESYLYMKITGAAGIIGSRMPFGKPPLQDEQIEAIRQWIADGAANN